MSPDAMISLGLLAEHVNSIKRNGINFTTGDEKEVGLSKEYTGALIIYSSIPYSLNQGTDITLPSSEHFPEFRHIHSIKNPVKK